MFAPCADRTLPQQPCRGCAARRGVRARPAVHAAASKKEDTRKPRKLGGLGDLLGPIGLTLSGKSNVSTSRRKSCLVKDAAGFSLVMLRISASVAVPVGILRQAGSTGL